MSLGFSISELITAAGTLVQLYNGFCSEHGSAKEQLTDLIYHLNHFKSSLEKHKSHLEKIGMKETEYVGFAAVDRLLNECRDFLNTYDEVVGNDRTNLRAGYQTIRLVFNPDGIRDLRQKINFLEGSLTYDLNLDILGKLSPDLPSTSASTSSSSLPSRINSIPQSPQIKRRPVPVGDSFHQPQNRFPSLPSTYIESQASTYYETNNFRTARSSSLAANSSPVAIAPRLQAAGDFPGEEALPPLVLPQAALGYVVVKVICGEEHTFDRKPLVRDWQGGREIVIIDENSNVLLSHKIECGQQDNILPYTWHSKFWRHEPFEVTFKGIEETCHVISPNDNNRSPSVPKYIFTKERDHEEFQGHVSGKTLAGTFEVHHITSATSVVHKKKIIADARYEHLKCWKSKHTQRYTISYYANNLIINNVPSPRFLEFPLAFLHYDIDASNKAELEHRFNISEKAVYSSPPAPPSPRKSRTLSWGLSSRSPTLVEGGLSSPAISASGRGSLGGNASSFSSATTGQQSSSSIHQYDLSAAKPKAPTLQDQMKYIHIEFSTETDATRFLEKFKIWRDEEAKVLEETSSSLFREDWDLGKGKFKDSAVQSDWARSPNASYLSSPEIAPESGYVDISPDEKG